MPEGHLFYHTIKSGICLSSVKSLLSYLKNRSAVTESRKHHSGRSLGLELVTPVTILFSCSFRIWLRTWVKSTIFIFIILLKPGFQIKNNIILLKSKHAQHKFKTLYFHSKIGLIQILKIIGVQNKSLLSLVQLWGVTRY